jgi:hypothetical protein
MSISEPSAVVRSRWPRVVNGFAVGFSIVAGILGIISILGWDYSDAEIEASLVDTWQAAVLSSYLFLFVTFVIAFASFVLVRGRSGATRGKLLFTGSIAVIAFVLLFTGMLILTRRAELLQDSDLSGLFYLF